MDYSGDGGAALAPDEIDALARDAREGDRDALERLLAEGHRRGEFVADPAEAFGFDDGRLKTADYSGDAGFGQFLAKPHTRGEEAGAGPRRVAVGRERAGHGVRHVRDQAHARQRRRELGVEPKTK